MRTVLHWLFKCPHRIYVPGRLFGGRGCACDDKLHISTIADHDIRNQADDNSSARRD